ncbi:MAG: PIN domain nuclease [bacterium]|nr:PIN domain nuclease [bacterium]
MFLVDTSVWIDYLRKVRNDPVIRFEEILEHGYPFGITGVIYQEILQGADSKKSFARLEEYLSTQEIYEPADSLSTYTEAARIYFQCRRAGITIRSTIDCLIARIAIENDLVLLHNDRDFDRIGSVVPGLRLFSGLR